MRELRDQLAHGFVVLMAIGVLAYIPHPMSFAWGGFVIGLTAEIKERGSTITINNIVRALHSWKDLTGYAIAGLLIGVLV